MRSLTILLICGTIMGCSTKQETKIIKGTPMMDVVSYGYEVTIEINNENVYAGSNTSYSGILIKGVQVGKNTIRINYKTVPNPEAPDLKALEVKIRHIAPETQASNELLRWEAPDEQGEASLEFALGAWENHPLVSSEPSAEELLILYDKVLKAMIDGDIDTFKKLRDSEEIAKIEKIRSYQGTKLDAESLKSQAQYWPDWKAYQQTGLVKSPSWIRVDFQRDSPERDATNKPRTEFLLILFKKEPDGWKLSRMARISNPKYTDEGQLATLTDPDIPGPVRVPPQE